MEHTAENQETHPPRPSRQDGLLQASHHVSTISPISEIKGKRGYLVFPVYPQ